MKVLKVVLALAVVIAIAGAYMFPQVRNVLGAFPGPVITSLLELEAGVIYGNVKATSTPASLTIVPGDLIGFDTIIVKPTSAAASKTITFFASSTARHWLPNAGDTQKTCFLNATTTSGVTLVFAAGSGIDLQAASSSPTDLTILPDTTACFTFVRKAKDASISNSFDIEANMVEFTDAD